MQKGRRQKRQLHNRPNIALRLAAVLLVMVCISTWMMDGLFAKYRTSSSGQDSARVIGFGNLTLTEEGDFGTAGGQAFLIPGVDLKKDAVVEFTGSESATYVFVEAEVSEHWTVIDNKTFFVGTDLLKWAVADGWLFLVQNGNTYVYYRELAPNVKLEADFIAENGKITVSKNIKRADMANIRKYKVGNVEYEKDIKINLRASVVQSNGFSGPKQAWDSISGKSSN